MTLGRATVYERLIALHHTCLHRVAKNRIEPDSIFAMRCDVMYCELGLSVHDVKATL